MGRWFALLVAIGAVACASLSGLTGPGGGVDAGGDVTPGACQGGQKVCDGQCVPLTDPNFGCGAPDCAKCSGANVTEFGCRAGACVIDACAAGLGDCDRDPTNGCEADLTGADHCGACDKTCSGATGICNAGTCIGTAGCQPPLAICGTSCVDAQTNPVHCGASCTDCSATTPANSTAACLGGTCSSACAPGWTDCDGANTNGCECAGTCGNNQQCCLGSTCARDAAADVADAGPTYLCNNLPVPSCADCQGMTTPCAGCSAGGKYVYTCETPGIDCKNSYPQGVNYCQCQGVAECALDNQVCIGSVCRSCGEGTSNQATCKNGKVCDKGLAACL